MTNSELKKKLLELSTNLHIFNEEESVLLRLAADRILEDGLIQMSAFKFETTMWRMFNFGIDNNTVSAQCEIQAANITARPETKKE